MKCSQTHRYAAQPLARLFTICADGLCEAEGLRAGLLK